MRVATKPEVLGWLYGIAVLLGAVAAFAEELPIPDGAKGLQAPYDVMMGSQPVKGQRFETALSVEQVQAFYQESLPKAGWTLSPAPWLAKAQEQQERFRREVEAHPEVLIEHPEVKERLDQVNDPAVQGLMARQIHAVRGKEHLLLSLGTQRRRTFVLVARWQEGIGPSPLSGEAAPENGASPAGGLANPCCGGDQVPAGLRQLPESVPRYPNARMLSTGMTSGQRVAGRVMSELYATADSAETVAQYYEQQMAYNGWSQTPWPGGKPPVRLDQLLGSNVTGKMNVKTLSFRNDVSLCGIVAAEADSAELTKALVGDSASASKTPSERTLIMVNYIETPSLNRKVPLQRLLGSKQP